MDRLLTWLARHSIELAIVVAIVLILAFTYLGSAPAMK